MKLDLFVWVINLLDRDNVVDTYESTACRIRLLACYARWSAVYCRQCRNSRSSLLTGEEKYEIKQADPRNYDTPRQIRIGARWTF